MQIPQFLSLDAYLESETTIAPQLRAGTFTDADVPLLNYAPLHQLPDNTLVRFRGMVQDMLDPEIYLERYEVRSDDGALVRTQDGRYRDMLVRKHNEIVNFDNPTNGERRPLFLVSIPGLNDWAVDVERERYKCDIRPTVSSANGPSNSAKRPLDDDDEAMDTGSAEPTDSAAKRPTSETPASTATSVLSAQYLLNSPLPDRPGKACLAKIYERFDDFPLNTCVEVIGFLSVNPVLDATATADDPQAEADPFRDEVELQAANPPPSLVPRLHCVHVRPLRHLNPLLADDVNAADGVLMPERATETYADLLNAMTQCLFGDRLAAEYLICHLASTVYVRTDLQALGQFSLNLSGIPADAAAGYTTELYSLLEAILPASHLLPLTLDNLNTLQFEPKKDYKTNKLTSGVLQLAPHTHLVLDETRLQAGQLQAPGVQAVRSIANLIRRQQLQADFQFYQLDFSANVPVLCLSEGRSMLPSDCLVPVRPSGPEAVAGIADTLLVMRHFVQARASDIRRLLTLLKLQSFDMAPECLDTIQSDFVQMRRANQKTDAGDLHALLVLSRLVGLCRGASKLTLDLWQHAKQMDEERRARLAEKP